MRFIESHGQTARVRADGRLDVLLLWSKGGVWGETWEVIPATLRAAKDWLGY